MLLLIIASCDVYNYAARYLMDEVVQGKKMERNLLESLRYLWEKRAVQPDEARVKIGFRFYVVQLDDEGYPAILYGDTTYPVYEDEASGKEYVDLDASGQPSTQKGFQKEYVKNLSHQSFLLEESILLNFYIHYLFGVIWLFGLFKDILGFLKSSTSSKTVSPKAREQAAKKLLAKIKVLIDKGKHAQLIEILTDSENRGLLHSKLDRLDIHLGKAYLQLGEFEKGISILKRFSGRFKNDEESKVIIGEYYSKNRQHARIQDISYLLAYLETTEDVDFMSWLVKFVFKYKLSDRHTVRGLVKICATEAATAELRGYVLEAISQWDQIDSVGEEFFQNCKMADPDNPRPRTILAEIKLASGRFDEALDELEELLNLDYENQKIHEMLYTIYDLKGQLNDLFLIYTNVLEEYPDETIAVAQQRKIQMSPDFDHSDIDRDSKLSLAELLDRRKKGDSAAEQSILRKYERRLTIMFTDIKGYTAMTESQSVVETMAILQESDDIILPLIARHEGEVIKKIGDAYMARFESSESAIMAAIQIQQSIRKNNLRREKDGKISWHIRIGLNTGDVIMKDGDVFGDVVNVASRVESQALVDGVFCTAATRDDVSSEKFKFVTHQSKKLKGKLEAMDLFSVVFDLNGSV